MKLEFGKDFFCKMPHYEAQKIFGTDEICKRICLKYGFIKEYYTGCGKNYDYERTDRIKHIDSDKLKELMKDDQILYNKIIEYAINIRITQK